jgi:hypothetical protein
MKQNVKIVFDRKGQAEKNGTGKIELYIYLSRGEKKYEVVRLDPKNIISNDSINKLKTSVMDYIDKIDTTLSIINAKTEVTIEY